MSGNPPFLSNNPSPQDIQAVKDILVQKLTEIKRPIIIDSCLDVMLSQITHQFNPDLFIMFKEYFSRLHHDPLLGDNKYNKSLHEYFEHLCCDTDIILNQTGSQSAMTSTTTTSSSKEQISTQSGQYTSQNHKNHQVDNILGCCLPCSCLTLLGDRAVKYLQPNPVDLIKTIQLPDAFTDYFLSLTDIDDIALKILNVLEYGGKYEIEYYTPVGFISQIMINEINTGKKLSRKQRNSTLLKTIGMRIDSNYAKLDLSQMQIIPGMLILMIILAKVKNFCDGRKVIHVMESIANTNQNYAASFASIRESIRELIRASEKFNYGSNAYNTVKSIAWKFAGYYLLLATSKKIPIAQDRLDDVVDEARNIFDLNKRNDNLKKDRTRICFDLARDVRDFALHILAEDFQYWLQDDKLRILVDFDESLVERIIASLKELTGINLADKKWLTENVIVSHDFSIKL